MMQVQMPKFVKISSDFICIYEKITGGQCNCCLSLCLNIVGIRQGPGKMLLGSCKVLKIFVTKRVGTWYQYIQI